jgi:hypothetical protein
MKETKVRGCGGWTPYPPVTAKRGTSCDCSEKGWGGGMSEWKGRGLGGDLSNVSPKKHIWSCHKDSFPPTHKRSENTSIL